MERYGIGRRCIQVSVVSPKSPVLPFGRIALQSIAFYPKKEFPEESRKERSAKASEVKRKSSTDASVAKRAPIQHDRICPRGS